MDVAFEELGERLSVFHVVIKGVVLSVKVAVQVLLAFMVTCPDALQSPLQPVKVDEAFGVAVAVTEVHDIYVPAPVVVPDPVHAVLIVRA